MYRIIAALAIVPSLFAGSACHAAELTDLWVDAPSGARATLIQHGERLSLDLHRQIAIDGAPHLHAPALERIGLDVSGLPVFAGTLADGTTAVSVEPRGVDRVVIEVDAIPRPMRFELARPPVSAVDLGGQWIGGYRHAGAACPALAGPTRERAGVWTIVHPDDATAGAIGLRFASTGQTCQFRGRQATRGRLSRIEGAFACTGGIEGTFATRDLVRTESVMGGTMDVTVPACGMRRLHFGGVGRGF